MPKSTSKSNQAKDSSKKLNETGNRKQSDRRQTQIPVATERRKVQRRRQIDPTTCEREYNEEEIEFMHALDEYKRSSGRMFPTCSEILEVFLKLGYRKLNAPGTTGTLPVTFTNELSGNDSSPIGLS